MFRFNLIFLFFYFNSYICFAQSQNKDDDVKLDLKVLDSTLQGPIKWKSEDGAGEKTATLINKKDTAEKSASKNNKKSKKSVVKKVENQDISKNAVGTDNNLNQKADSIEKIVPVKDLKVVTDNNIEKEIKAEKDIQNKPKEENSSIGENNSIKVPELIIETEKEQDVSNINSGELSANRSKFFKGTKIEDEVVREKIKYVYVSRGAWLIVQIQPYIDSIGLEVLKKDSNEITASYVELIRSFSFLCSLIAADDGSEEMLKRIAAALANHRRYLTSLRLAWPKKSDELNKIFKNYLDVTFLRNINDDQILIPAGTLGSKGFVTMEEISEVNSVNSGGLKSKVVEGLGTELNDEFSGIKNTFDSAAKEIKKTQ